LSCCHFGYLPKLHESSRGNGGSDVELSLNRQVFSAGVRYQTSRSSSSCEPGPIFHVDPGHAPNLVVFRRTQTPTSTHWVHSTVSFLRDRESGFGAYLLNVSVNGPDNQTRLKVPVAVVLNPDAGLGFHVEVACAAHLHVGTAPRR